MAPAAAAVAAAPPARDGSRRVRYVNPLNGGTAMELIDCFLVQLDPGMTTLPFRTNASSVCCVVEGAGESQVGNKTVRGASATSSRLPQGNRIVHRSTGGTARLFAVSDRDMYARLGLLKEEYGNLAPRRARSMRRERNSCRHAVLAPCSVNCSLMTLSEL